jgi:hypothetical protein
MKLSDSIFGIPNQQQEQRTDPDVVFQSSIHAVRKHFLLRSSHSVCQRWASCVNLAWVSHAAAGELFTSAAALGHLNDRFFQAKIVGWIDENWEIQKIAPCLEYAAVSAASNAGNPSAWHFLHLRGLESCGHFFQFEDTGWLRLCVNVSVFVPGA